MLWQPEYVIQQIRLAAEMAEDPNRSAADVEGSFLVEEFAAYAENMARFDPNRNLFVAEFRAAVIPLRNAVRAIQRDDDNDQWRVSLKRAAEAFHEVELT